MQNLKVQLAGAHGNHKEAMDQVNCLHCCPLLLHLMLMLLLIAKPLRAEGAQAEPHILENLVTHRAEKIWLSPDCPCVHHMLYACAIFFLRYFILGQAAFTEYTFDSDHPFYGH